MNKPLKCILGFTLIELIVVIALLSILAIVALPRLMNHHEDAHYSTVAATGGALSSAVMLLRGRWVSNGAKGEVDGVVGYGKNDIATTLDGWPSDSKKGEASIHSPELAGDANRCVRIWEALLASHGIEVSSEANAQADYLVTTEGNSLCIFTYQESKTNSRIEYDLSSGTVLTVLK